MSHQNLAVDLTIKLRSFDEPRIEDLSAVSDWVLMINPTAATKMNVGLKRKCVDDPFNEPIPAPPMPITPSPISNTPTHPNQFPALSSISPDALLRGKRVVNGVDLDLQLFQELTRRWLTFDRWSLVSHQKCMEWKSM